MWRIKKNTHTDILMVGFKGIKDNRELYPRTTLYSPGAGVYEVVLLKLRTCLNNFSITPETSEGTPHRAGNKGHDLWVKSVTREAKRAH